MDNDIVPALLEQIQKEFEEQTLNSKKLKSVFSLLKNKKATYLDVNDFAIEVGEILADVLGRNITVDVLPDGKMYFNIAERILNPTMQNNYNLISDFAVDVQSQLNQEANLKLKGQKAELNQDKIDGIINRVSNESDFETIKWILDDPIINFSQSVVDDSIKANADFHYNAGLKPNIIRRLGGDACEWCKNLAGIYPYHSEPKEVYQRHERCRCTVDYRPSDARRQNVWTKAWRDPLKAEKIANRKTLNLKNKE